MSSFLRTLSFHFQKPQQTQHEQWVYHGEQINYRSYGQVAVRLLSSERESGVPNTRPPAAGVGGESDDKALVSTDGEP